MGNSSSLEHTLSLSSLGHVPDPSLLNPSNQTNTSQNSTNNISSSGMTDVKEQENKSIVTAKLVHYLEKYHRKLPMNLINFIVEPLSIESELSASYLDPSWKTTSRMLEIYEFLCMKSLSAKSHVDSEEDKKIMTLVKNTLENTWTTPNNSFESKIPHSPTGGSSETSPSGGEDIVQSPNVHHQSFYSFHEVMSPSILNISDPFVTVASPQTPNSPSQESDLEYIETNDASLSNSALEESKQKDSAVSKLKRTLTGLKPKLKFNSRDNNNNNTPSTPSVQNNKLNTSKSSTTLESKNSLRNLLKSDQTPTLNPRDDDSLYSTSNEEKPKNKLLKRLSSLKKITKSSTALSSLIEVSDVQKMQNANLEFQQPMSPNDEDDLLVFDEDEDAELKQLKTQYFEERKQKRELLTNVNTYLFNEQEFMENENLEHAKLLDDILFKRIYLNPETYSDTKLPNELPSYIRDKIDFVGHQRNIDLLNIKMIILDCSCKQSLLKILSPVKERLEVTKEHRKYNIGLQVGPWLLTFHEDIGLIVPSKVIPPLDSVLYDLGTLDVATNVQQLCTELSNIIVEWNTCRYYSKTHADPPPSYLQEAAPNRKFKPANNYDFFMEFLSKLGVRVNLADNPSFQHFLSHIKKLGSSPFVWVTEQKETIVFKSHAELDEYVNRLSKSSNTALTLFRPLDYELLKTYDRLFWSKYLTFPMVKTFDPTYTMETTLTCPFKHPFND
ncbi:hypothetical protein FDP41_009326 [Naegleria fowleri]|uniref:Uncharacterized protein n=1 Tax=Naegleria fowleri TaxID=5763 RepID=A0A6A5AXJ8_NAEFO|nr:uncharacterized protein FDP41_009326 [Naegleria fowleri]KAF0972423.1 hypothetical protein FDP41_009326 [Naegleria fowleri]CAG4713525.1 unnamed protein product [Naegleria fowleri]